MLNTDKNRVVLFGGDLNIREKEITSIGNLPNGVYDLWNKTGKRKECLYTWDMNKNTNLSFPGDATYKPRARFDRLYYREANDTKTTNNFKPVYFELEGIQPIKSINRYASDHWAIQCYFDF